MTFLFAEPSAHYLEPPSRGRSFTQVTMCGEMAPHPRLPGFSGVVLSQKCPPSSNSKRAVLRSFQFWVTAGTEEHSYRMTPTS
jgi:hypothetical protein